MAFKDESNQYSDIVTSKISFLVYKSDKSTNILCEKCLNTATSKSKGY